MRNKTILTQSAWYHATSGEIFSDVLTYRLPLNLIFPTATQRDTPPDSLDIRGYHIFLQWILMRKSHMLQGNFLRLLQLELIQLIDGNKFTMKSDTAAVSAQRYVRTEYTWEGKIADLWHDWAWEQGTNYYNGERPSNRALWAISTNMWFMMPCLGGDGIYAQVRLPQSRTVSPGEDNDGFHEVHINTIEGF